MKNQPLAMIVFCLLSFLGSSVLKSQILMVDNFDYPVGQLLTDHGLFHALVGETVRAFSEFC